MRDLLRAGLRLRAPRQGRCESIRYCGGWGAVEVGGRWRWKTVEMKASTHCIVGVAELSPVAAGKLRCRKNESGPAVRLKDWRSFVEGLGIVYRLGPGVSL